METRLSHEAMLQLFYEALALRDVSFQSWLAISFGAILAIYFANAQMTRFLRALLVSLYLVSAIVFLASWFTLGAHVGHYFELLQEQNLSAPPIIISWVAPLMFSIMALGSIVTTYFLVTFRSDGSG